MLISEPGDVDHVDERSPRYAGWRVVAALFVVEFAIFGFGLYGQGIYVAELRRLTDWPVGAISAGSTMCLVLGSLLSMFVSDLLRRIGPRLLILGGIVALASGLALLASATSLPHLYAGFLMLALAWVGLGTITAASIIGAWFDRKRGLAISLAFMGATFSGIILMPGLVALVEALGVRHALLIGAAGAAIVLVPLVAMLIRVPDKDQHAGAGQAPASAALARWTLLGDAGFLYLTVSFAMATLVQVAFIVHQISILTPAIGFQSAGIAVSFTTAMALVGRIGLGIVADRINPRHAAAASIASQAVALFVVGLSSAPAALFAACAIFGFSIGNLITLPALLIQREFPPHAFSVVLGLSMAIAGVINACGPVAMGLLRDVTGGYAAPLLIGVAIQLLSSVGLLVAPQPLRQMLSPERAPSI